MVSILTVCKPWWHHSQKFHTEILDTIPCQSFATHQSTSCRPGQLTRVEVQQFCARQEGQCGSGGVQTLDTRSIREISFTPWPIYPPYLINRSLTVPQRRVGRFEEERIPCTCQETMHVSSNFQLVA